MKLAQVLWVLPLGVVVALLHAWRCDIASAQLGGHPISLGADLFALEGLQDSGTDVTPAAGRGKGGGGGADVADTAAGPGHGIATRSGETAHTSSQRQAQPFGGSCGTQTALIVVGVLAAPTAVSLAARQLIRETWGSYPTNGSLVTRFILGTDKAGKIPALLLIEAQKHKDIVFVDAEDDYHKLAPKVRLYIRWATEHCSGNPFVMKTDTDVFIHVPRLLSATRSWPQQQLWAGKFMRRIPARKNGKAMPDNDQNLHSWPWYTSGAGYVFSWDVARTMSALTQLLPMKDFLNEDVAIGAFMYGFNVTYHEETRFKPWGHCEADTILMHYHRVPELMHRRWRRFVRNQSICGEQFAPNEVCAKARSGETAVWSCPAGTAVASVLGATYGKIYGSGGAGSCSEGREGLEPLPWCHANTSQAVVEKACIGQSTCQLKAVDEVFGADPCPGFTKHILAAVACA